MAVFLPVTSKTESHFTAAVEGGNLAEMQSLSYRFISSHKGWWDGCANQIIMLRLKTVSKHLREKTSKTFRLTKISSYLSTLAPPHPPGHG
jgi:hypothetical protein